MSNRVNILVFVVFGFLFGVIFSSIAISVASKNMLIKEIKSPYDFEKSVRIIEERINSKDNWHTIITYDQNAEIQKHGGESIGNMKIIKYCSGEFASKMLVSDDRKKIGAMMPKSIAVYEKSNGEVFISMSNGAVLGKLLGGEFENIIEEVSLEVEDIMSFVNFKFNNF